MGSLLQSEDGGTDCSITFIEGNILLSPATIDEVFQPQVDLVV